MPRHNQQHSRVVTRFNRTQRREPIPVVYEARGTRVRIPGTLEPPTHWSRVSLLRRLEESSYNAVRSIEELQDFVARY